MFRLVAFGLDGELYSTNTLCHVKMHQPRLPSFWTVPTLTSQLSDDLDRYGRVCQTLEFCVDTVGYNVAIPPANSEATFESNQDNNASSMFSSTGREKHENEEFRTATLASSTLPSETHCSTGKETQKAHGKFVEHKRIAATIQERMKQSGVSTVNLHSICFYQGFTRTASGGAPRAMRLQRASRVGRNDAPQTTTLQDIPQQFHATV